MRVAVLNMQNRIYKRVKGMRLNGNLSNKCRGNIL